MRFTTVQRAVAAYNSVILEQANTHSAFAQRDRAILEASRVTEELKDAHKIHKTDKLHRDIALLSAEEQLRQMKHEAKLAKMEREAELRFARKASEQDQEGYDMSDDERELVDALLAKIKPDRYRVILEKTIREQNLGPEDEDKARAIMEEIINQSL